MTDLEAIISHADAIVDTFYAGAHDIHTLIDLRRELAVYGYRLSSFVKQVHGEAGLSYAARKYRVAEKILDMRRTPVDGKAPSFNYIEQQANKSPDVVEAHKAEIMADAQREAVKAKLDFIKQVLSAMQQEISVLSHEMKNAHFQNEH